MDYFLRKVPVNKRGVLIAFLGQDGAGKSTVTDDIVKWLNWKIEARKFYLGSGEHYFSWQKKIKKIIHSSNPLLKILDGMLAVSDAKSLAKHSYKTLLKAKHYCRKGGIAIFDRFPQVQFVGINDGPKIRSNYLTKVTSPIIRGIVNHYAAIEEKYLKKASLIIPDLVIKLILPPEVSIQRKPQEDLENVKQKHEIIKSLEFPGSEVHVVDATMNYQLEMILIKNCIWDKIVEFSDTEGEKNA